MGGDELRVGPARAGGLEALEWLARVGCSPIEPLALVSGCGERTTRDHVRRLEGGGLVRRVAMTRGAGSLIVVTERGARVAGEGRLGAPRSVAPSTWAHASRQRLGRRVL